MADMQQHIRDFLFDMAMDAEDEGDILSAAAIYRGLLSANKEDFGAAINLGRIRMEQGRPEKAQRLFEHAVKVEPDHPVGWFNLGVVRYDLGRSGAAWCYRKALQLDPSMDDAKFNLNCLRRNA